MYGINTKIRKDAINTFVNDNADIIIIYLMGSIIALFLSHYHTLILGMIGTLACSSILLYDAINHDGDYSLYKIFCHPKNIKILLLVGYLLIESIICVLININNFLNI